jgi:DNA polymerase III alpha subunit
MAQCFCHLHLHTHYSLLDGFNRIPSVVEKTKELGMNACAITDHGNLFGAVEFYTECKKAGVNPVIGYEAYLAPGPRTEKKSLKDASPSTHLTLLAKNNVGFKNLIKMSSVAYLEGFYYNPRIDRELLEAHSEGIICLSGCLAGEFNQLILAEKHQEAEKLAKWFHKVFKDNFYIEIQNNGIALQDQCTPVAADIANKLGVPLVATADAHYLCAEDATAHDVLFCINTRRKHDPRKRLYPEERMPNPYYVRSPEDMYRLFPEYPDAVARSQEIADGVDIELDFKKRHFPVFTPPERKTPDDYLRELCERGMRERYGDEPGEAVRKRLDHELATIAKMGFSSYFLIVWDFVRFAREEGIPCTARGSGCGALVSYVLYLSHVDPLEYDLLFERFLDPNRSEAPDIDIDFCQDRRDLVIEYVKRKYGVESVAQIGTFGTLATKAALKDVGRALDIPLERVNFLCKLVPTKGSTTIPFSLDETLEQSQDFRREYEQDPQVRYMVDIARKLEGMNRNVGTHAAGVVIANGPITDYVPVQRVVRKADGDDGDNGGKGEVAVTTQWEMGVLEKIGLLKMDFLGLRTLTLIDNTLKLIKRTRGIDIDVYKLPLDDKGVYQLLQRGDAKGVFQLEGEGIRELLKRMKPDNIRDLIAVLALYRPGPLEGGMVDEYVECKNGRRKPTYPHPVMEEVLSETYGVMCIHEDARVAMADGTEKPIRDVRRFDRVHSLNLDTRQIEVKECHGCGPTRRCDGLRITLENGFSVTLTPDHKVWTWEGWKEARELDLGRDLVAVGLNTPQELPEVASLASWLGTDEDVAYLFGLLTGDGCLTSSGVTIATGTKPAHDRICTWLADRFPSLRVTSYFHLRSWYVNLSHPELLNDPAHGNRKTKFHHLLDTHGLKKKAINKRVPEAIFRSPAPVRAAFLAGVLDSDGCLATNNRGAGICFISSASPGLVQDLRRLCQLIGVAVKVYPQRLQVWGLARLREEVEPYLVVKQFPAECPTGSTVGWVPREELFAAIPAGESQSAFAARTGIQRRGMYHDFPFVKSSTARKAGIRLGDARFFRIESVEVVADQQFYGMSVADHHNLLANGIVVKNCYQEQVMRILNRLGGIELSKAYACIKAISKKNKELIAARKEDFIKGCGERGMSAEKATEIFELIELFGGYAFNKSHTAAYAQIGYQTAYLKHHYPAEFMAALLSSEIDDGNKRDMLVDHIADARKMGIDVLVPDVNRGMADFDVQNNRIIFGLTAIKGLGRGAAEEIVRARNAGGKFKDFFDFCERVDRRIVQKAAVEKMVMAGAFDSFGRRAAHFAAVAKAYQAADERAADRRRGQKSFLDMFDTGEEDGGGSGRGADYGLPDVPEWPETEKLKFEKEALDFYMSSHPLAQHDEQLRRFRTHDCAEMAKAKNGSEGRVGGMIVELVIRTANKGRNAGRKYATFRIEDFTGTVRCIMWSDEYARFQELVAADAVLLFEGVLNWAAERAEPDFQVKKVMTPDEARREFTKSMLLKLPYTDDQDSLRKLDAVGLVLKRYRGNCPVYLSVRDANGKQVQLKLNDEFRVNPAALKVEELEMLLGQGAVLFSR